MHVTNHTAMRLETNLYQPTEGDTLQICVILDTTPTGSPNLTVQIVVTVQLQEGTASMLRK